MPDAPLVITGATGFLGRAVVRIARQRGLTVVATGRGKQAMAIEGVTPVRLTGYRDTPCPEGSRLIHLAEPRAASGPIGEKERAQLREQICVLLDKNFSKIVYASSAIVYGDREPAPRKVGDPTPSESDYARIKREGERMLAARGGGVSARISNLYGPNGMAPNSVLGDILAQIGRPGPLRLRDADAVRDFLHVDDAAACLIDLATGASEGIFNVGSGRGTSAGELARLVVSLAGEPERPVVCESPETDQPSTLTLDISATTESCRWRPRITLEDGLRGLIIGAA